MGTYYSEMKHEENSEFHKSLFIMKKLIQPFINQFKQTKYTFLSGAREIFSVKVEGILYILEIANTESREHQCSTHSMYSRFNYHLKLFLLYNSY